MRPRRRCVSRVFSARIEQAEQDQKRRAERATDLLAMDKQTISNGRIWSAVGSMALCVAMLIASEFMPVSLLTPIANDLGASEGMTGQAISISGLFAVVTSVFIATIAGRFDRRRVLIALTGVMLASLVLIAEAPSFPVL